MKINKLTGDFVVVSAEEQELRDLLSMADYSLQKFDFDFLFSIQERHDFFTAAHQSIQNLSSQVEQFKDHSFQVSKKDLKALFGLIIEFGNERRKPDQITNETCGKIWLEVSTIHDQVFPLPDEM